MAVFFDWRIVAVLVAVALLRATVVRSPNARRALTTVASLSVIASLHPVFAGVIVAFCAGVVWLIRSREAGGVGWRGIFLPGLTVCLALLGIGKYGLPALRQLFEGSGLVLEWIGPPLGLSYLVFRVLQYAFDHHRGVIRETSVTRLLAFACFLPTFPAGPIETYTGFDEGYCQALTRRDVAWAVRRILIGYVKKVVLGDLVLHRVLRSVGTVALGDGLSDSGLYAFAYVVLAFMRAYVDLSAYTDLAVGFGLLLGQRVMENFDRPLWRRNLAEFWRSWHISLSMWCRNNVYFPVFGATRKPWLGLYASMLTMGLWHYVNWNWFAWAVYHGTGLIIVSRFGQWLRKRKTLKRRAKRPSWVAAASVLTFLYVALGYSFVATPDIATAGRVFLHAAAAPFHALHALVR